MFGRLARIWMLLAAAALAIAQGVGAAVWAQEKSVRPGINDQFAKPDVAQFVERFEHEGREVFDHREEIVRAANIRPGMSIADIGAGTGLFTRMFASRVGPDGRVYAVEIAQAFLDHIQATCREAGITNVTGVLGTQTSVQLPSNSIDLAFICDTYHHLEYPYRTMRSIRDALRPEGELVLVEFHRIEGESSEWVLDHVRAGKETFTREIELAGFKVVDEQKFLKTSYFLRFSKSPRKTAAGHTEDSLETVKERIANKEAVLIDVREHAEWDAGHVAMASLVPLSVLEQHAADRQFLQQMSQLLPRDKTIYCHCRSGNRVLAATEILEKHGYDIRPLRDGYAELIQAGFAPAN